jgi:hypothetical protein
LSRGASLRPVWISGVLALVLGAALAWYLVDLQPGVLALQLAFGPQKFGEIVHAWSPPQLLKYRQQLLADGLLLLTYAAFGYLLVVRSRVFADVGPRLKQLAKSCLPLAALFDAAENGFHWWLTEVPRFGVAWVYAASATCALLKWALLMLFGLLLAYALASSAADQDDQT